MVLLLLQDDNLFGESTRDFLFDPEQRLFYYLDANFTSNGGARPAGGRPIYLYVLSV